MKKPQFHIYAIGEHGRLIVSAGRHPEADQLWKRAKFHIDAFARDAIVTMRKVITRNTVAFELRDLAMEAPSDLLDRICDVLRDTVAEATVGYKAPDSSKFEQRMPKKVAPSRADFANVGQLDSALASGELNEKRAIGILVSRASKVPAGTYALLRERLEWTS